MPLNPPSYKGQDVWYSPNTYVNQVQVALWQPAVPMPSGLTAIPHIPDPPFRYNAQQLALMDQTKGQYYLTDAKGNQVLNVEGHAPNVDAPPGQLNSPANTYYAADPAAGDQGGYKTLIANLAQAARDGLHGSWNSDTSLPNIKNMLSTTGADPSVVTKFAWCATFAGYMLKLAGLPYAKTKPGDHINTLASAYLNYGQAIDVGNQQAWRQGDIICTQTNSGSGSHVAFVWGVNAGTPVILGGNQGKHVAV